MVKKFNEFIITESFQSGKLRRIIAEHGKPRWKADEIFLHDLKDDEIYAIMSYSDWCKFRRDEYGSYYGIQLKDDTYIVIKIEKLYATMDKYEDFKKEFDKRRNERHKGNEFNDGIGKSSLSLDRNIKHFREEKRKLEYKRNIEKINKIIGDERKEFLECLYDACMQLVDKEIDGAEPRVNSYDTSDCTEEFEFNDIIFSAYVEMEVYSGDSYVDYGAEYIDPSVTIEDVIIYCGKDVDFEVDAKDVFTEEELKYLFDKKSHEGVEIGIADEYEYYGVSRSDFY